MQENEFEKRVREQMEEFKIAPNEEVWQQVKVEITKKKRRRVFFYWIFAALLLTGGVGILLFNKNRNNEITNVSPDKKPANDLAAKKPVIKKKDEISDGEKDMINEGTKVGTQTSKPFVTTKKTKTFNHKTKLSKATRKQVAQAAQAKQEVLTLFKKENVSQPDKSTSGDVRSLPESKMEGSTGLPPHKYLLPQTDRKLEQDTLGKSTVSIADKTGIETPPSWQKNNTIKEKKPKNILGKWHLGFTIYTGVSDNTTGIGLAPQKSFVMANRSGSFSFQSSSSAFSAPSAARLQYKSGASFGAGAYLQKGLTKKLSVTVGVDYHYMSAKSLVGNKVDATLNVYDSAMQKPTVISPFYRAGQTTSYSNKYHLIQLPVNLQVQLNKNMNHPFLFSLGLSPSFLVASNALYLNSNARVYYREKKQFNHFMLFGQSELLYTLSNSPKYQLRLGPALQYDFNSFSKSVTHTRQHLIFTGIKTNITLK
jgi:hypothetical protein